MKRAWLLAATVAAPGLCYAATGASYLARVPALPASANAAYALWNDKDGTLTPGAQYHGLETEIQAAVTTAMPGQNPAAAQAAQNMAAHYNTPQGQADIANMSMAQKMAMAQQMQAQMGYGPPQMAAGPVSDSDGALVRQIQPYPGMAQMMQKNIAFHQSAATLEAQWDKDANAIGSAESAERNKLPVCRGEAGEPSELAIRTVALKYADRKIALADSYLPKFAGMVAQYRQTVTPEVAHGDAAAAAWAKLGNPGLKSQLTPVARGAETTAVNDAYGLLGLVEEVSRKAAASVADKHRIERLYANAKGC